MYGDIIAVVIVFYIIREQIDFVRLQKYAQWKTCVLFPHSNTLYFSYAAKFPSAVSVYMLLLLKRRNFLCSEFQNCEYTFLHSTET